MEEEKLKEDNYCYTCGKFKKREGICLYCKEKREEIKKFESELDIIKYLLKNYKLELFGGKNKKGHFAPALKKEEWFEFLGIKKHKYSNQLSISAKRKDVKRPSSYSIEWFRKIKVIKKAEKELKK